MPQDNPRSESQRSEHARTESSRAERSETARAEESRSEASATAASSSAQFAEMGANSIKASLRMQKEMFDTLQDISRDWLARATSEAELAMKLPNRLTSARTMPDAFSAYRDWLKEWLSMCGEDGRRFISDGQKIMDTGTRCFTSASPAAGS